MEYTLIKGHFHVVGHSPDGDSIKFRANNQDHWQKLNTDHREILEKRLAEPDKKTGTTGVVTLRLQGIDALETHYSPPSPGTPKDVKAKTAKIDGPKSGMFDQPEALGKQATYAFLYYLGILKTKWHRFGYVQEITVKRGRRTVTISDKFEDKIPGYIITRDAERKGRPIAWVFAGKTSTRDGSSQSKGQLKRRIKRSVNYQLLEQGLVYPYFYMTLPSVVREQLIEAVNIAQENAEPLRRSKRRRSAALAEAQAENEARGWSKLDQVPNLWVYDTAEKGIALRTLDNLTKDTLLWPYLFRKLLKYWRQETLQQYWEALRQNDSYDPDQANYLRLGDFFSGGNPYMFIVGEKDFVRLDEVVEIKNGVLKMRYQPQNLVFLS